MVENTNTVTSSVRIGVPYRLTWANTYTGRIRDMEPGHGDAGWTMAYFSTKAGARKFIEKLPGVAYMPGTHRLMREILH